MDLDFSEEQDMLRDLVRGLCSTYSSLEVVRSVEDDPTGYPVEFWQQLAELDLTGLMIPEEYGGSGMTALEGAVVYEEFGRALAPSPHFVSAVLSAGVLLRAGSDEQRRAWLPRIAKGEAIVTTAWLEPKGSFGPKGVQATATVDGKGPAQVLADDPALLGSWVAVEVPRGDKTVEVTVESSKDREQLTKDTYAFSPPSETGAGN